LETLIKSGYLRVFKVSPEVLCNLLGVCLAAQIATTLVRSSRGMLA